MVTMVLSAVCLLLGENASSWTVARQAMSDGQFLKRLVEIDMDAIPEKVRFAYEKCGVGLTFTI